MLDPTAWIQAISSAIGTYPLIKKMLARLPDSKEKQEALEATERAEQAFQLLQAEQAQKLEYPICRRHWPPEVMLSIGYRDAYTEEFQYPQCGEKWPGPEPPAMGDDWPVL